MSTLQKITYRRTKTAGGEPRLTPDLDHLRALVQSRTRKRVREEFDKESLVFTGEDSPIANLTLSAMGPFTEFGRSLIRERQREGNALAKQRGVYKGRKKTPSPERAAELARRAGSGVPKVARARVHRTSRKTVFGTCLASDVTA